VLSAEAIKVMKYSLCALYSSFGTDVFFLKKPANRDFFLYRESHGHGHGHGTLTQAEGKLQIFKK
jgi:hypothetical protein